MTDETAVPVPDPDCIPTALGHHCPRCNPAPTPQHLVTIDGDLIREVARVQHDKTIQAVRDLVDSMATTKKDGRDSWETLDRTAREFRDDLTAGLLDLRQGGRS